MPKEKKRRKRDTPMHAMIPPVVWVDSVWFSPVRAIPAAVMIQLIAIKGSALRIMYLLPSLSMKKTESMVPVALKAERGMFNTSELSLSVSPGIVIPAFSMISGP